MFLYHWIHRYKHTGKSILVSTRKVGLKNALSSLLCRRLSLPRYHFSAVCKHTRGSHAWKQKRPPYRTLPFHYHFSFIHSRNGRWAPSGSSYGFEHGAESASRCRQRGGPLPGASTAPRSESQLLAFPPRSGPPHRCLARATLPAPASLALHTLPANRTLRHPDADEGSVCISTCIVVSWVETRTFWELENFSFSSKLLISRLRSHSFSTGGQEISRGWALFWLRNCDT